MDPLIINAAITGMIPTPKDNPNVPVTVSDIVADVRRCAAAGASIVHIHARDGAGAPSWRPEIYREIFAGIRANCPDIVISGTTSGRLWSDFERRSAVLDCQPDLASLTPGSMNFPSSASLSSPDIVQQLAQRMRDRAIAPELELFELGMIDYVRDYLIPRGFIQEPFFANLILGSRGTMAASTRNLVHMVDALPATATWAATGIGSFQFSIQCQAIAMGGHVRTGLEDNLWTTADKTEHASNPRLIERVVNVARAMGRPVATPDQARRLIGLSSDVPLCRRRHTERHGRPASAASQQDL